MKLMVLGSGQDAGIPQVGCYCKNCTNARRYKRYRRLGPSIAVYDKEYCTIIDATPDLKDQLHMLKKDVPKVTRAGKLPVSAILLTHSHMGHIMGLSQLGKESINEVGLPVYTTPKMKEVLKGSHPLSQLIKNGNIKINTVGPGTDFTIGCLTFETFPVPHRDEVADTIGFVIHSEKKVVYIPDTDHWNKSLLKRIEAMDIALIDGSFYSKREIPRYTSVPHPPITETMKLLKDVDTDIYFTHLNHTNIINSRGREYTLLEKLGFKIAYDGMTLKI